MSIDSDRSSSTLLNRYILHEQLWQSGVTSVYRATHIQLKRVVAIKFLSAATFEGPAITRFQLEARAIASLQHPNILQVYDFDRSEDGRYFMATEYFPHGDLQRHLDRLEKRGEYFNVSQATYIVKSVGVALGYAHSRGIIHRDIKPSNIFLDGPTRVVVGDFGLVKLQARSDSSVSGALVGTPTYMSPEQATGGPIDHRTDIYALGVLLFYLASGVRPYAGDSVAEVVAQHLNSPIPDITQIRPEVPPSLQGILARAMAKDPKDRYATAEDFVRDLAVYDPNLENGEDTIRFDAGVTPELFIPRVPSTTHGPITATSSSSQSLEVTLKVRIAYWKLTVGIVALAVAMFAGLLLLGQGDKDKPSPQSNIPPVTPAQGDEVLILVAPMVDEATDIDVGRRIMDWVETGEIGGLLQSRLRVEALTTPISSDAEALQVGETAHAEAVIWGKRDGAGWHIMVVAPNRAANELRELRLLVPNDANLETMLIEKVPVLSDLYLRVLLVPRLAKEGNLLGVFFLTFDIKDFDPMAFVLADRPLDQNITQAMRYLSLGRGLEADTETSAALELVNGDIALYYMRWAANVMQGNIDLTQTDAERLAALTEDGEFATGLRLIALYLLGEIDTLFAEAETLDYSTSSAITIAFSMIQQARIGEGQFAEVEAQNRAYVEWLTAQGVANADNTFLESMIYLRTIQGDAQGVAALMPRYQDFRDNRFYLAANVFFRRLQPTKFAPIAFAFGGFREATIGQTSQARLTYNFGLGLHPDDYLLNWQSAMLDVTSGEYQRAYDRYSTAVSNAPVPFPIARYDQAMLVVEHGDGLDNPRSACELLTEATKLARTDADFYAALLDRIAELSTAQGCQ
ncbi:MAG: protein kinase [Anaerolineae bacterium]|nr:protein kinase [Anaerolineae bacterium]